MKSTMDDVDSLLSTLKFPFDTPQRMPLCWPGTDVPLKDEDGNEAWIELYSIEAKVVTDYNRDIERMRSSGRTVRKAENQNDLDTINMLAAATVGWHLVTVPQGNDVNPVVDRGKVIPLNFSRETAIRLYTDFPWIRRQLVLFFTQPQNFTKASSQS